jgi:hypothetical protein
MVIGNPAYDLVRSGLSLASPALGSDFPGIATGAIWKRTDLTVPSFYIGSPPISNSHS